MTNKQYLGPSFGEFLAFGGTVLYLVWSIATFTTALSVIVGLFMLWFFMAAIASELEKQNKEEENQELINKALKHYAETKGIK